MDSLRQLYVKNRNIFDKEASKILVNNKYYQTPNDLLGQRQLDDGNFYIW